MPNLRSAKKALRQNVRRRKRNAAVKKRIGEKKLEFRRAIVSGDKESGRKILDALYSYLDKAVKTGVLSGNAVRREKSRLAKRLAALAKPR